MKILEIQKKGHNTLLKHSELLSYFALELLSTISFEGFESKTLEIISVMKDPTFLDPGLVPEVKLSSHTILQCCRLVLQASTRLGRNPGGFPARGYTILEVFVRSGGSMRHLGNLVPGFSSEGPWHHSWSIPKEFILAVYFCELGTN